jgi:hypothetical protein
MRRQGHREAAFPDELLRFEVVPDSACRESDVRWSGGGDPAIGSGRRFETAFSSGGTFVVAAHCLDAGVEFQVEICDVNAWMSRAVPFYGPSIDFSKVTVKSSSLVIGPAGTGWTCNNVIRFKRPSRAQDLPTEATFIHELGHVWEHQTGQAQLLKGITEQIGARFGRDPYDFGGPGGVHDARVLRDFSKEGQAQIIMELWKSAHGYERDSKNVPFSTAGYVDDLRRLVESSGIGTRFPGRRTVVGTIDAAVARLVNGLVDLVS